MMKWQCQNLECLKKFSTRAPDYCKCTRCGGEVKQVEEYRPGARKGAVGNRSRTGFSSKPGRQTIVLSRLGQKYPNVYHQVAVFRKSLERAYIEKFRELDFAAEAEINLAARYEMMSRLAEHMIAIGESTNPTQDMKISIEATKQRNLAIRRLKISKKTSDTDGDDPWKDADLIVAGKEVPPPPDSAAKKKDGEGWIDIAKNAGGEPE